MGAFVTNGMNSLTTMDTSTIYRTVKPSINDVIVRTNEGIPHHIQATTYHIIRSKMDNKNIVVSSKRVIDEEYANRALDASNFYIVPWRIALSCIKDASARLAGVTI